MTLPPRITRAAKGRPALDDAARAVMRQRIADAARGLFAEHGYAAVSMRRVAAEIGCAPMTLYGYYDSKLALLHELWGDAFTRLFAQLRRLTLPDDPAEQLLVIACRYVHYWCERPDEYRMIFMTEGVSQAEVSLFVVAGGATGQFGIFMALLAAATRLPRDDAALVVRHDALICALHGIAHSLITISGYPWADADAMIRVIVTAVAQPKAVDIAAP